MNFNDGAATTIWKMRSNSSQPFRDLFKPPNVLVEFLSPVHPTLVSFAFALLSYILFSESLFLSTKIAYFLIACTQTDR